MLRHYLHDATFSPVDRLPDWSDTHTDEQRDRHTTTAYAALSIVSRGKKGLDRSHSFKYLSFG